MCSLNAQRYISINQQTPQNKTRNKASTVQLQIDSVKSKQSAGNASRKTSSDCHERKTSNKSWCSNVAIVIDIIDRCREGQNTKL